MSLKINFTGSFIFHQDFNNASLINEEGQKLVDVLNQNYGFTAVLFRPSSVSI